ncbi:MAG: hypothetical protein R2731_19030 [Nocardioides sp.]
MPVDTYRTALYTPRELFDALDYHSSLDARAYAWSRRPSDLDDTLAVALHDHAIDDALAAWVAARRLVGVMGGHRAQRGDTEYAHAARLGRGLGAAYVVATGGGPGAMEAANLGAYLAPYPAQVLADALELLAGVPSYRPDISAWVESALTVRGRWPDGAESLGIPTWHFGHEPPTPLPGSSRSTSATPRARPSCWRCATAASCSCPAPGARCRRSSRTPARTTTPTSPRPRPWCWWVVGTGPTSSRHGRSSSDWPAAGRWSRTCIWWTPSTTRSTW